MKERKYSLPMRPHVVKKNGKELASKTTENESTDFDL